jgi:hypothetical protein
MSFLKDTKNRMVSADDFYEILEQTNAAMGRVSEPSKRLVGESEALAEPGDPPETAQS